MKKFIVPIFALALLSMNEAYAIDSSPFAEDEVIDLSVENPQGQIKPKSDLHPSLKKNIDPYFLGSKHITSEEQEIAYKALVSNIPVDPDFSVTPAYAIVGRDGKFIFSVGASAKGTMCYDFNNPYNNPKSFEPGSFTRSDNKGKFSMTFTGSNVHFNFVGLPGSTNEIGVFFELGFGGGSPNSYNVDCGHAYLRYRGFTFGKTTTVFSDQLADPVFIDGHGLPSNGGHGTTTINWQHYFNAHIRIGVGLELPRVSATTAASGAEIGSVTNEKDLGDKTAFQKLPDLPLYFQYRLNDAWHIRAGAVFRALSYHNYYTKANKVSFAAGGKFSTVIKTKPIVFMAMVQGGKGIASYLQENDSRGIDMTPRDDEFTASPSGEYNLSKSWGAQAAFQINWSRNIFSTVGYGYMRNYVDKYEYGTFAWGDHLKSSQMVIANVLADIKHLFRVGVEYCWGQRTSFCGDKVSNNRVYAMFQVQF